MYESFTSTVSHYWTFYVESLKSQWHNMTPMKYGILLISIGVVGFLSMKSSTKRC
ncbi:MAG: hypothetical protein IID45_01795 [Planctomycetes bacterium]|nr:hypothetical protein [Planctomycetota bacterium]